MGELVGQVDVRIRGGGGRGPGCYDGFMKTFKSNPSILKTEASLWPEISIGGEEQRAVVRSSGGEGLKNGVWECHIPLLVVQDTIKTD